MSLPFSIPTYHITNTIITFYHENYFVVMQHTIHTKLPHFLIQMNCALVYFEFHFRTAIFFLINNVIINPRANYVKSNKTYPSTLDLPLCRHHPSHFPLRSMGFTQKVNHSHIFFTLTQFKSIQCVLIRFFIKLCITITPSRSTIFKTIFRPSNAHYVVKTHEIFR